MQEAQTEHKETSPGFRLALILASLAASLWLVYEQRFGLGATLTEYELYGALAERRAPFRALPALVILTAAIDLCAGILVACSISMSGRRRRSVGMFGLVASVCLAVVAGEFLRTWLPWYLPLGVYAAIGALITILIGPLLRERGVLHMALVAILVGSAIAANRLTIQIKVYGGKALDQYRQREYESLAPIRFLSVPDRMSQARRSALVHAFWSERREAQIPIVLADWGSPEARSLQAGGIPGYDAGLPPDTLRDLAAAVRRVYEELKTKRPGEATNLSKRELLTLGMQIMQAAGIWTVPRPPRSDQEKGLPFLVRATVTEDGPVLHCDPPPGQYVLLVATPGGSIRAEFELSGNHGSLRLPETQAQRYREYIADTEPGMPVLVQVRLGIYQSAWILLTLP